MTTAVPSGKKAEIRRSYHEQLDDLCHDVCRLGALATEAGTPNMYSKPFGTP